MSQGNIHNQFRYKWEKLTFNKTLNINKQFIDYMTKQKYTYTLAVPMIRKNEVNKVIVFSTLRKVGLLKTVDKQMQNLIMRIKYKKCMEIIFQ